MNDNVCYSIHVSYIRHLCSYFFHQWLFRMYWLLCSYHKSQFCLWNPRINCIFNSAERSTVSAESTTTTRMPVNDTASPLSTGRLTSAASLESTTYTSENVTGMIHNWQIATHISDIFLYAGIFREGHSAMAPILLHAKNPLTKNGPLWTKYLKNLGRNTPPCPDSSSSGRRQPTMPMVAQISHLWCSIHSQNP